MSTTELTGSGPNRELQGESDLNRLFATEIDSRSTLHTLRREGMIRVTNVESLRGVSKRLYGHPHVVDVSVSEGEIRKKDDRFPHDPYHVDGLSTDPRCSRSYVTLLHMAPYESPGALTHPLVVARADQVVQAQIDHLPLLAGVERFNDLEEALRSGYYAFGTLLHRRFQLMLKGNQHNFHVVSYLEAVNTEVPRVASHYRKPGEVSIVEGSGMNVHARIPEPTTIMGPSVTSCIVYFKFKM